MSSRIYSIDSVHVEALVHIPEAPSIISVTVAGWVPTSGWSRPDIGPWAYIVPPKDGVLDLDFLADPPNGIVLQVLSKIAIVKAFPVPNWVKGVRIHSATNVMESMLPAALTGDAKLAAGGWPLPWPFPWFAPEAKK